MRKHPAMRVLAVLLVGAALLCGQLNRGTILGTVTDPSGAAVPGVKIAIVQTATGARYETESNETGQYWMPNLPIGRYELRFEAPGFVTLVRGGLELTVTEALRVDVTLQVGSTVESITVSATIPRLNTDSPELGTNMSNRQLADLPFNFSFGRLIENLTYKIVPGVYGNRWQNNINGSVNFTREALVEGASVSTNVAGGAVLNAVSLEAVQEFKVQTSGMSAEFGRTNSGVYNYVLKSGTNQVHGSLYGSLRNEALNANGFVNNARGLKRAPERKQNYAVSLGGPVYLPKLYKGTNKTFFYGAFEHYRDRNLIFGAPNRTAPAPEFYQGDFSRLLGPATGHTDALGRAVPRGAIYDPATFQQLPSGRWIGEMFPGNRIPSSRFSLVSRNWNQLLTKHYLPTFRDANGQVPLVNNMYAPTNVIPISDQFMWSVKGDHFFNEKHKLAGMFSFENNPRTLMNQGGLFDVTDKSGGPLARTMPQTTRGRLARLAHDWTLTPRLLNHMTLSYNRLSSDSYGHMAHVDGASQMGIRGLSTYGYPELLWNTGPFVILDTPGRANKSFNAQPAWGFLDTVNWSRGRHFFKFGYDMRRNHSNSRPTAGGSFSFHPRATAIPAEPFSGNLTGFSFASYLLGIVDSAGRSDPVGLGGRIHYYAVFVQDDFKATRRLTLNLGVRWEYQPPQFEVASRLASWNPRKRDPESGLLGAYDFAGNCHGCTGRRYFGSRSLRDWGPRLGFALRATEKWTVRGAYGIFYIPDVFNGAGPTPFGNATSFQAVGTYQLSSDPVTPWRGIFNWDGGFPQDRFVPPSHDVSWGNRNQPAMMDPDYGRTGYTQMWNLNLQRELPGRFVLDIGYVGNKSTGLRISELARVNQLRPEALVQFGTRLGSAVTNPEQAAANGIAYPYPGFRGTVASALRPYPQVQGNQTVRVYGAPLGFGTYHGLQVTMNRELASGFTLYSNYVFSKTMGNMESMMLGDNPGRPLDYYNLALEKAVAAADRTHFVKLFANYELPVGRGRLLWSNAGRLTTALLGGWSLSGIVNYGSGLPLGFGGSMPSSQWNGAVNRANVAAGDLKVRFDGAKWDLFNPRAPENTILDKSKFSDPAPLQLGTGAVRYDQVRSFPTVSEDLALMKNHHFGEGKRLQFRADMLNAFNRSSFGGIVTAVTNPNFGQVTSKSGARSIQFLMRLEF